MNMSSSGRRRGTPLKGPNGTFITDQPELLRFFGHLHLLFEMDSDLWIYVEELVPSKVRKSGKAKWESDFIPNWPLLKHEDKALRDRFYVVRASCIERVRYIVCHADNEDEDARHKRYTKNKYWAVTHEDKCPWQEVYLDRDKYKDVRVGLPFKRLVEEDHDSSDSSTDSLLSHDVNEPDDVTWNGTELQNENQIQVDDSSGSESCEGVDEDIDYSADVLLSDDEIVAHIPVQEEEQSTYIGRHVRKSFDGKMYAGKVTSIRKVQEEGRHVAYYHIVYEDEDEEDLELRELLLYLL